MPKTAYGKKVMKNVKKGKKTVKTKKKGSSKRKATYTAGIRG